MHKRWYDVDPTVSLAVSLMRNASIITQYDCADLIINKSAVSQLFSQHSYALTGGFFSLIETMAQLFVRSVIGYRLGYLSKRKFSINAQKPVVHHPA